MRDDVNVIIINHGEFGSWLINSAELIIGHIDKIEAFSLVNGMSIEDLILPVERHIQNLEGYVVILTDMFGGTPNNVAMYLKQKYQCEVISGINLPMLLELIMGRDNGYECFDTLISKCVDAGKEAIKRQQILEMNNE